MLFLRLICKRRKSARKQKQLPRPFRSAYSNYLLSLLLLFTVSAVCWSMTQRTKIRKHGTWRCSLAAFGWVWFSCFWQKWILHCERHDKRSGISESHQFVLLEFEINSSVIASARAHTNRPKRGNVCQCAGECECVCVSESCFDVCSSITSHLDYKWLWHRTSSCRVQCKM